MSRWDVKPNSVSQDVPHSEYGVIGIGLDLKPDTSLDITVSTETGYVLIPLSKGELEAFLKGTYISIERLELVRDDLAYILERDEKT